MSGRRTEDTPALSVVRLVVCHEFIRVGTGPMGREDVRIWSQELSIPQSGFLLCFPLCEGQKEEPFSKAT